MNEIDVNHRRAVAFYQRGNSARWAACLAARRVVGKRDGGTAALASDLCLSVDRIEDLAKAGELYVMLRKRFRYVTELRRRLSPSHFTTISKRIWRYRMTAREVMDYLLEVNRLGGGVRHLAEAIENDYRKEPPPPTAPPLSETLLAIGTMIKDVLDAGDLPRPVALALRAAKGRIDKALKLLEEDEVERA